MSAATSFFLTSPRLTTKPLKLYTHMLSFTSHSDTSCVLHELNNKLMFYIMPSISLFYWALWVLVSIILFGSCLPLSNVYTFIFWRLWVFPGAAQFFHDWTGIHKSVWSVAIFFCKIFLNIFFELYTDYCPWQHCHLALRALIRYF